MVDARNNARVARTRAPLTTMIWKVRRALKRIRHKRCIDDAISRRRSDAHHTLALTMDDVAPVRPDEINTTILHAWQEVSSRRTDDPILPITVTGAQPHFAEMIAEEMESVIAKLATRRMAPGDDGITYQILAALPPPAREWLRHLLTKPCTSDSFRPRTKHGQRLDPEGARCRRGVAVSPFWLLPILHNLLGVGLLTRVRPASEGAMTRFSVGFRPHRRAAEMLTALGMLMSKARERNQSLVVELRHEYRVRPDET